MPSNSSPPDRPISILSVIAGHTDRQGTKDAVIFLERGEIVAERLAYAGLRERMHQLAGALFNHQLDGKRVVIGLPSGTAFVAIVLACLRIGAIAIPVPFPMMGRQLARSTAIIGDARPAAIITEQADPWLRFEGPKILTLRELERQAGAVPEEMPGPGRPALIQYTSGSTQVPRGIVVTHGNLLANAQMIQHAFEQNERGVSVSWLPHFHDMGLVGTILQPLFVGGTSILMPPLSFIQKPIRWLRAIAEFGATTAGAPCFGYDLCVRRVPAAVAPTLDLSTWRLAFCGSEPVRASVLQRFAERFKPAGFSDRSFVPCYGLAEATLIVTSAPRGRGPWQVSIESRPGETARPLVSCGRPVPGCRIAIRSEDGTLSPSTPAIGEIYVGGPNVSPGYWSAEAQAVVEFPGTVADSSGTRLVPTGDIGTIVGGELVPVDRIKDLIIIHGTKIHAIDIEAVIAESPYGEHIMASAAFCVDSADHEELLVLCEVDRGIRGQGITLLEQELPKLIGEAHGILPRVAFLPYGSLLRTSSGKIERAANKGKLLRGEFAAHLLN